MEQGLPAPIIYMNIDVYTIVYMKINLSIAVTYGRSVRVCKCGVGEAAIQ